MAVQTLFEVHTLKGGSWVVDSTYPDRDGAIEVAKSLHGEKRFEAVKVIKDTFDPATGNGKEIVVFDTTSKTNKEKPAAPAPEPAPAAPKKKAEPVTRSPSARRPKKKSGGSDMAVALKVSLWLVVILVGGLGALYLLHFTGGMFQRWF